MKANQYFSLSIRSGSKKMPGKKHSEHFVYSYDIGVGRYPYSRVLSLEISPTTNEDVEIPELVNQLVDAFNKGLITIETTTFDYEKTNPELKELRAKVRKKRRVAPTICKTVKGKTNRG